MFKRIGAMIKNAFSGQGSTTDMSGATGFCVREELSYREIGWKLTMGFKDGSPKKMYCVQINPFRKG